MQMERITQIIAAAVVTIFSSFALATTLAPGIGLDKPGQGLSTPYYTAGLPSYFVPANEVTSIAEPIAASRGNMVGTLVSTVYRNPSNSQLTFEYQFTNTGTSDLVRAALDAGPWVGVTIYDAGADGTGASIAGSVGPDWTNGDPIYIGRDQTSYPYIQWEANDQGTDLIGPSSGDSANIWFSTDATNYQVSYTGLVGGGAISSADLLAPATVTVVPEPITTFALGFGLAGLVGYIRRRRMASK
jgi:hypothetical protein